MESTDYLKMNVPGYSDAADILKVSENFETLDDSIKNTAEELAELKVKTGVAAQKLEDVSNAVDKNKDDINVNKVNIESNAAAINDLRTDLSAAETVINAKEDDIKHFKTWAEYEAVKSTISAGAMFVVDEDNPENQIPKHNLLKNRDEENAHPISAIEGLQAELDGFTKVYATVDNMKSDASLHNNDKVKTLGYYATNDGGTAFYIIKSSEPTGYYEELSSGLYAELIVSGAANIKQFGAKAGGEYDNTNILQYVCSHYRSVYIPRGSYAITSPLEISHVKITGDGFGASTLKCVGCDGIHIYDREVIIEDLYISNPGQDYLNDGIKFVKKDSYATVTDTTLSRVKISYFRNGITSDKCQIWDIHIVGCRVDQHKYCVLLEGYQNTAGLNFCVNFESCYFEPASTKGYSLYANGSRFLFTSCNFALNRNSCVMLGSGAIYRFVGCNFEIDRPFSAASADGVISIDSIVEFDNCEFLDQYTGSVEKQYFINTINNDSGGKYITFSNCVNRHYNGSTMSSFMDPNIYEQGPYGCILINNSPTIASFYDVAYNHTKPKMRINGKPIKLYKSATSRSKLKLDEIYLFRNGDRDEDVVIAYYNGTNLVGTDGTILY